MKSLYSRLNTEQFIIAGPCVLENEEMAFYLAEKLISVCEANKINFVFKASFDKANRTSIKSFRGLGLENGLRILQKIRKKFQIPIVTDVHETSQIEKVSEVVDIIQIPAFLCRQTDLLINSAMTQKIVNVKKGQFLSGKDMKFVCEKIESVSNEQILLTERGNSFGYKNLVVDFKNLIDMQNLGYPTIFDVTHSCKDRDYVLPLTKAAAGMGIKGFFYEIHENPSTALSDSESVISVAELLECVKGIQKVRSSFREITK